MVNEGWSVPTGILAGLAAGAAVGMVNSFVVLKMGVPVFIATLAMLYMARGITYLISKGYSIYPLPEVLNKFGVAQPLGISWRFFVFIVLAVIFDEILRRTVHGRKLYAVGGNKEVAKLAGIVRTVSRRRLHIGGHHGSARRHDAHVPDRDSTANDRAGLELNAIAAVVIGGVSLWGGSGLSRGR